MVHSSLNDPAKEAELLKALPEMNVDGAVILPIVSKVNIEEFFALKIRHGLPFVVVDQCFDGLNVPYVVTDDVDAGYRLTRMLCDRGHEQIAFVGEGFSVYSPRQRYEGYVNALQERGIHPNPAWIRLIEPYTAPEGTQRDLGPELEGYRQLLTLEDRPTAVVCVNNYHAKHVIDVAGELGLSVPGDLSVAGIGGKTSADLCRPPLTFMRQDPETMGREAFRLLRQQVENPERIEHAAVPAGLWEGESVCSPQEGSDTR
jgi:DNA-binding LacI/PurR family transcriptional regulator